MYCRRRPYLSTRSDDWLICLLVFHLLIEKLGADVRIYQVSLYIQDVFPDRFSHGKHFSSASTKLSQQTPYVGYRYSSCKGALKCLLGNILKNSFYTPLALMVWLPKKVVYSNFPKMFHEKYRHSRCIIDCTQVYIERSKSLDEQAATWSDYKKHNTEIFSLYLSK